MKVSLILCALSLAHASEDITPENRNLGGDLDDNGCLTSGGYSWCESQSKCIRSWEEDCEDEDDTVTVGDDRDESGCIASAGYAWCESQSKCLRSWEEDCEDEDETVTVGNDRDDSGCIASAGYVWCESKSKCVRSFEEDCEDDVDTVTVGNDRDDYGCIASAGYVWCESKSECIINWEEDCEDEGDTLTVGNDRDDSGCISSAGYVWCEYLQDCVQIWTLDSQSLEECDTSVDDSASEDTLQRGEFGDVEDGAGSDESEGDSHNYDREAEIRGWKIRFFAITGPFLVCVPLLGIYRRRKRRREREAQRNVMIQMLSDRSHHSQVNVAMETIAVKNNVKASGPAYEAFTNAV